MNIYFDPLFSLSIIYCIVALAILTFLVCLIVRIRSILQFAVRLCIVISLIVFLLNPVWISQETTQLPNIGFVVYDQTASQSLGNRPVYTQLAENMFNELDIPNLEIRSVYVAGKDRTDLLQSLERTQQTVASKQIAGAVLVTDGQIHDDTSLTEKRLPSSIPLHVLLTGSQKDFDARVVFVDPPAYVVTGKPVEIQTQVLVEGNPTETDKFELSLFLDGERIQTQDNVVAGQLLKTTLTLDVPGKTLLHATLVPQKGEITQKNNEAYLQINTVQDRLRVLLVSGEPYAGERSLRSLLKSDPSVDLVHFTILRPPNKPNTVPVDDLALIEFPVQELFEEKLSAFDLIIFDRYQRRGILPADYFSNIASYVKDGGAVFVIAGETFAGLNSLANSALEQILPGQPTFRTYKRTFVPTLTSVGYQHPVTKALDNLSANSDKPSWGEWYAHVDLAPVDNAQILMHAGEVPLLLLKRVGKGRVALLGSDNIWLWARNVNGGGPYRNLMRRTSHWLMQEPELEEEKLLLSQVDNQITITRQTLQTDQQKISPVTVTLPDMTTTVLEMEQDSETGTWQTEFNALNTGIYKFQQDTLQVYTSFPTNVLFKQNPEMTSVVGTEDLLKPVVEPTKGKTIWMEDLVRNKDFSVPVSLGQRIITTGNTLTFLDRHAKNVVSKNHVQIFGKWPALFAIILLITFSWLIETGQLRRMQSLK